MKTCRSLFVIATFFAFALQGQTSIHAPEEFPISALKTPADSADVAEEFLSDASTPKDSVSDSVDFRERPMEPMSPLGLTIGKSGEDVYIASDAVGIGTNSPGALLDLYSGTLTSGVIALFHANDKSVSVDVTSNNSALNITSNKVYDGITINNTAGVGDPHIRFQLSGSDVFTMGVDDSDADKFKVAYTTSQVGTNDYLIIQTDGNVGIGTATPSAKLEVRSSAIGTAIEGAATSETGFNIGVYGESSSSDGSAAWFKNWGSGYGLIVETGNVGIGTTTPSAKLEVAGQVKITGGTPGAGKVLTSDADGLATWETVTGSGLDISSITQGHHFYKGAGASDIEQSMIYEEGNQIAFGAVGDSLPTGEVKFNFISEYTNNLAPLHLLSYYDGSSSPTGQILSKVARGTTASPSALMADDILTGFAARGHDGTDWTGAKILMLGRAEENWEAGKNGTYWAFQTTKSGTDAQSEKMRITGVGNVGIGTTTPEANLHVINHSEVQVTEILESYSTVAANLKLRRAGGTFEVPEALDSGTVISNIGTGGWNGESFPNSANIRVLADEDLTPTAYGTRMDFRVIGRGTNSLIYPLTLTSDANVGIFNQEPDKILDIYSNDTRDYIRLSVGGDATSGIDAAGILLLERSDNAMGYIGLRNNHDLSRHEMVFSVRTGADPGPYSWDQFMMYVVDDDYLLLNSDGGNVGIGTTSPSSELEVVGDVELSGYIDAPATWGENARTQGILVIPEGTTTADDGAGNLTIPSLVVMNPAAGSWMRVTGGTYTLGSWGYLYVDIPPTGTRGTTVTPTVGSWSDEDRPYDSRDRLVLAQRVGTGAIYTRLSQPANGGGDDYGNEKSISTSYKLYKPYHGW